MLLSSSCIYEIQSTFKEELLVSFKQRFCLRFTHRSVFVSKNRNMATPEEKKAFISKHMDADLHYLLEDAQVSLEPQFAIAALYRTVKHFSAFGDTRAELIKVGKNLPRVLQNLDEWEHEGADFVAGAHWSCCIDIELVEKTVSESPRC